MPEALRTWARRGGAWKVLAVRGALLSALASVLCCSPSDADPETTPAALGSDPVTFWMGLWRDVHHEDPMYRRLPAGVDTRGWEPMHEGFLDSVQHQEGFNRPTADNYESDYEFTWDAFTLNIPLWRIVLEPFAGQPNLRYLKVGVAEGRSLLWVLDSKLTHPSGRATGIDPFMVASHEERLRENLKKSSGPQKVELIKGFSRDVLPELEPESYDIIYIDGSHLADDVLLDAVYAWRLLRKGGLVIHDDYMQKVDQPPETHPIVAIDAFVTAMRNTVEVLHRGHQLVLRKLPLEVPGFC